MPASPPALELDGLVKRFGFLRAVDGLTLAVQPGEIYGLLGPNGAGKTTTLRVALDLLRPDAGHARIFGVDAQAQPVTARAALGYLAGEIRFPPRPSGGETLEFLGRFHPDLDPAFRRTLIDRLALDPSKRVGDYSKGNRQKLGIIAALQHRPQLALLDEPTTGLDPLMQREFYAILTELARAGSAVVFSSHVLSEVDQLCARVGVMREGKLVFEKRVGELAQERVRRIEVTFAEPVPAPESLGIPGVVKIDRWGAGFRIFATGDPDAIVKALARHAVRDVVFERPDLEDLFIHYYEGR